MNKFFDENKPTIIIIGVLLLISLIVFFILKLQEEGIEDEEDPLYFRNYQINELIPINMDEEQVARKYLAEYTKLIFTDPEKAYSLIEPEYRELKFNNINDFKDYFSDINENFFNANIKELNVTIFPNFKQFYVIDSNDERYVFREYSINNYKVMFDVYSI